MSGASDTLDPIAAAEAEIAGSKNLIAAVADDLGQQERWLAHYRVAEKRHARRVVLQEVMYRLERGLDRLMRVSRRLALLSLRSARWLSGVIASWLASLLAGLRHAAMACIIWLRPRMHRLALLLRIRLAAFWAWSVTTSRMLARASLDAASLGLAWLARQSQALAAALHEWLSAAAAFTGAKAKIWTRISFARTSAGYSYAARSMSRILHSAWRVTRRTEASAKALVLRRCTALACVAIPRAKFPAIGDS